MNDAIDGRAATSATARTAVEQQSCCYRCRRSISSYPRASPFDVCECLPCGQVARRDQAVAVALAQLNRGARWVTARQVGDAAGKLSGSQAFRALERLRCREWVEVRTAPHVPGRTGRSPREHRLSRAGRTALGDAPGQLTCRDPATDKCER